MTGKTQGDSGSGVRVMTTQPTGRTYRPSFVSNIIAFGAYGRIALLRDDPSRLFKFCALDKEEMWRLFNRKGEFLRFSDIIRSSHNFFGSLTGVYVSNTTPWARYVPFTRAYSLASLNSQIEFDGVTKLLPESLISILSRSFTMTFGLVISFFRPPLILKFAASGFQLLVGENLTGCPEPRYCRYRPILEFDACVLDDLFSLGSLFYEILTGYWDVGASDVFERFKSYIFPLLESIRPDGFVEIIAKCWNERYETIMNIQRDFIPIGVKAC